jgi:hypothetical protein
MSYKGTSYYDRALDAGYSGNEAEMYVAMLEEDAYKAWEEDMARLADAEAEAEAEYYRQLDEERIFDEY